MDKPVKEILSYKGGTLHLDGGYRTLSNDGYNTIIQRGQIDASDIMILHKFLECGILNRYNLQKLLMYSEDGGFFGDVDLKKRLALYHRLKLVNRYYIGHTGEKNDERNTPYFYSLTDGGFKGVVASTQTKPWIAPPKRLYSAEIVLRELAYWQVVVSMRASDDYVVEQVKGLRRYIKNKTKGTVIIYEPLEVKLGERAYLVVIEPVRRYQSWQDTIKRRVSVIASALTEQAAKRRIEPLLLLVSENEMHFVESHYAVFGNGRAPAYIRFSTDGLCLASEPMSQLIECVPTEDDGRYRLLKYDKLMDLTEGKVFLEGKRKDEGETSE